MNTMENNKEGRKSGQVTAKHAATAHLKKRPSALLSFTPIALLVIMLVATIRAFGSDSLAGASQVTLIAVSAFCVLIGMGYLNVPWASFEKAITKNVSSVSSALIILLLIGALGGAWMVSGVVPTLIYYGMHIIHPSVFLASTCLICALVSLMTGSSWTTIATIGIALMGIGRAQGFADGWVAGAIISGAYFGDKISPLSETTTLASGSLGVQLFSHIRYMLITTVPSITLALIIFAVASTATTGVMLNVAIADQYLCILLTGNMFRDVYDRENYERRLLSRTTEDAVTVTSVLVPWNTCGMTQSTVLGVATTTYLPYCFFNIISPIMSVVVAAIGYKIFRKGEAETELPQCGNAITATW